MGSVTLLPVVRIERADPSSTSVTAQNGANVAIIAGHDAERRRRLTQSKAAKPEPKAFAYDGDFGFWPLMPQYTDTAPCEYAAPDTDPA